jgi:hypothetical protein
MRSVRESDMVWWSHASWMCSRMSLWCLSIAAVKSPRDRAGQVSVREAYVMLKAQSIASFFVSIDIDQDIVEVDVDDESLGHLSPSINYWQDGESPTA